MNYVILDNNRFYAEGLRNALLRRNAQMLVESGAVTWRHSLLACDTLVVRCRFSAAADRHLHCLTARPLAGRFICDYRSNVLAPTLA